MNAAPQKAWEPTTADELVRNLRMHKRPPAPLSESVQNALWVLIREYLLSKKLIEDLSAAGFEDPQSDDRRSSEARLGNDEMMRATREPDAVAGNLTGAVSDKTKTLPDTQSGTTETVRPDAMADTNLHSARGSLSARASLDEDAADQQSSITAQLQSDPKPEPVFKPEAVSKPEGDTKPVPASDKVADDVSVRADREPQPTTQQGQKETEVAEPRPPARPKPVVQARGNTDQWLDDPLLKSMEGLVRQGFEGVSVLGSQGKFMKFRRYNKPIFFDIDEAGVRTRVGTLNPSNRWLFGLEDRDKGLIVLFHGPMMLTFSQRLADNAETEKTRFEPWFDVEVTGNRPKLIEPAIVKLVDQEAKLVRKGKMTI